MDLVHGNHAQNSQAAWIFCNAVTSAGRYPRRLCVIIRLLCWHKRLKQPDCLPLLQTWRKQTQTALGGSEVSNQVLLPAGEWVVFGTPSPFLKEVSPPKGWEGFLSWEIPRGAKLVRGGISCLGGTAKGSCSAPAAGGLCWCLCQTEPTMEWFSSTARFTPVSSFLSATETGRRASVY